MYNYNSASLFTDILKIDDWFQDLILGYVLENMLERKKKSSELFIIFEW